MKHVPICILIFNQHDSTMRPPDELSMLSVQSSTVINNNRDVILQLFRPQSQCCTRLCYTFIHFSVSQIVCTLPFQYIWKVLICRYTKQAKYEKAGYCPTYFFQGREMCSHPMTRITFGLHDCLKKKKSQFNDLTLISIFCLSHANKITLVNILSKFSLKKITLL